MRAVVQRVKSASVEADKEITGEIGPGLLIFLGVGNDDDQSDADYLVNKIVNLRIFNDKDGQLNLSAVDLQKDILIVSQFTLFGDCRKGRRPSFFDAAPPDAAEILYNYFVYEIKNSTDLKVETGVFQAMMDVVLINDGPVTLLIDSKKTF
ncbi:MULTISPECIES: D-aminoacyl-tRNA deacylase [unclassified Halanaerobium]|uniref:D-aminoacyl-tRNA deacylase n=1 Tax=unclassified Halanaerobium TaxID=2641197 RepID=UPI000DF3F1AD|nr:MULTISPECIES: D-aminoacyl-tRNA deacylase [unclassified Halanaerobium]RCW43790.1 D-tyrosyl-tRNA(Tyr) deacylase [Halanaerobium sp. MA284_MarDTE_T2]RCW80214.1 D-tyrosyl-tRNA(Tyr) deacylase [Halanaerobium sp. DL-01]